MVTLVLAPAVLTRSLALQPACLMLSSVTPHQKETSTSSPIPLHTRTSATTISIITVIFAGALKSNVQCLTCNTVSKTQETFQDLSLLIPSGEVREGQNPEAGWVSWAWGWLVSGAHHEPGHHFHCCFQAGFMALKCPCWTVWPTFSPQTS